MLRTPVMAANWKMHLGPQRARTFAAELAAALPPQGNRTVLLFPSAVSLAAVGGVLYDRPDLMLGAQNIHFEDEGAYTGELSAPMAKEAGARAVLVGHSERRHVFGETDGAQAKKVAAAFRHGLKPVLCVGETIAEREAGRADDVVLRQLTTVTEGLDDAQLHELTIAYEPVWAIGTGRTATPRDASAMHAVIREAIHRRLGDAAVQVPILYGGSVKPDNAADLLRAENVDGLLVGGASLDVTNWVRIATA
ncbi:MAG: triose-phosphate isomerase [Gemmatimonadota bacterium]